MARWSRGCHTQARAHVFATLVAAVFVPCLARCSARLRADDDAQQALAAMQGTWEIVSFTSGQDDVPAATLKNWRRTVKGNHVVWKDGDQTMIELNIKLDATNTPMMLDSTVATGDGRGDTMLAIYELKGDELRVCFRPPGEARPKEFFAAPAPANCCIRPGASIRSCLFQRVVEEA